MLVSMGGSGAFLLTEGRELYFANACCGRTVNTVGAGDSLVAGFLTGFMQSGDFGRVVQQVPDGLSDAPRSKAQGAGFLSKPLEGEGDVDALAAGVDGLGKFSALFHNPSEMGLKIQAIHGILALSF